MSKYSRRLKSKKKVSKKVSKKLLKETKKKVSRKWVEYGQRKYEIKRREDLLDFEKKEELQLELEKTRSNISKVFTEYREERYDVIHKSPYEGFKLIKTMVGSRYKPKGYDEPEFFRFHNTYQKIYKATSDYDANDLDNVIPFILQDGKVNGVLVVFEVELKDTGEIVMVSEYIQRGDVERLKQLNRGIYEDVTKKFISTHHYSGDLKFIYMRVVYKKKKIK